MLNGIIDSSLGKPILCRVYAAEQFISYVDPWGDICGNYFAVAFLFLTRDTGNSSFAVWRTCGYGFTQDRDDKQFDIDNVDVLSPKQYTVEFEMADDTVMVFDSIKHSGAQILLRMVVDIPT